MQRSRSFRQRSLGLALGAGLSIALSLGLRAGAETVQQISRSPISKVVAYQGQGIVTREVRLNLAAPGDYQLRVTDMPLQMLGDSLHVTGQGDAGVTIHNVQLMPLPPGEASPEVKQAKDKLRQLETRLAKLENTQSVNEQSQEWLEAYWERTQSEDPKTRTKPEDWQQVLDFLSRNQARMLDEATAAEALAEDLEAEIAAQQKRIAELEASETHKSQAGVIYFSARNKGSISFQLSYLVPGIHWTPSYDARLDEKGGKISLTYFGDIVQQTGETWQDVDLSLSTAVPQINAAVPVLAPWILTNSPPPQTQSNLPASNVKEAPRGELADLDELSGEEESPDEAGFAESEVQTQGLSVLFAIPRPVSIESAPHPRKVAIATRAFAYVPEYHVVPKLSPRVYLKARFRNTGELPLLAGQIRNYVDLDYTGTSQIQLVRPNEEASLNFGVDENIRVTRREGTEQSSLTGLMRDIRRRELSYEIEVQNFKNKPVTLVVWDHLPLVQNEQIHLQVQQIQPEPAERSKVNLLKWVLQLKPQEKRKISVSYAVEHPEDLDVYTNFSNEVLPARKRMNQEQYEKF